MEERKTFDTACIMLDYKYDKMADLRNNIDKNDINPKNDEAIVGNNCHVSLLNGITPGTKFEDFKDCLKPLESYRIILVNISVFECENYDVLKIDVKCPELEKTHNCLKNKVEYEEKYPDYHPHMTIAYLNKGTGEKYTKKMLDKIDELVPYQFTYGTFDKEGQHIEEHYNNKDLKKVEKS